MKDWFSAFNRQLYIKSLEEQIARFKSGREYVRLQEDFSRVRKDYERQIKHLEQELAQAKRETVQVREIWFDTFEELEKEKQAEVTGKEAKIHELEKRLLAEQQKNDELREKISELRQENYAVKTQLEEAEEKRVKLEAMLNKDFTNSSIPSSHQERGRKKIPNTRKQTGRKRGAQIGHAHHPRKALPPTDTQWLDKPERLEQDPAFYITEEYKSKQVISISLILRVQEYCADIYRNRETGAKANAQFPAGCVDDVNYDGTIKAFLYYLVNVCNVSFQKAQDLLYHMSGDKLKISTGMICHLCQEFAKKSVQEKDLIWKKLVTCPVMNADFTNANVNGESAQVLILASESEGVSLFIGKEKKGHAGIKDTPLEVYGNTVVHDHDTTFYNYGNAHQECMAHNIRYCIGSEQNEPHLTWSKKMHEVMQKMLHYRNEMDRAGAKLDPVKVAEFEKEYDDVLELARQEYEGEPPSDYYKEGYNLYKRLVKYRESELLFLHDQNTPTTNSLCERLARVFKRKQKQVIVFRSLDQFQKLCDGLSVLEFLKKMDENILDKVADIFDRPSPPRQIPKKELATEVTQSL